MNVKLLLVGLLSLFLLIGCSNNSDSNKTSDVSNKTLALQEINEQNYPALKNISHENVFQEDGYYGVIRVFSRHYLKGLNNKGKDVNGNYVVHGAGGVISINGNLYILTAKHNIIPDIRIRQIKPSKESAPIEFNKISDIQSQILIGGFGVQPKEIMLSKDEDVCVLSISDQDRDEILKSYNKDRFAPISINNEEASENPSGMTVEVWGFPAQHNPQVEHVLISASAKKFLSINRSLLRGYSGGPVFILSDDKKKKSFAGIITRADDSANQSIVLPYSLFSHLFDNIKGPEKPSFFSRLFSDAKKSEKSSDLINIKKGDEITMGDVKYKYLNYP